jgi:hypothetical protein
MKELELVKERLRVGRERYGHGVCPLDDTRQWGTKVDSWLEMGQEEILDCLIYMCADYIRVNNIPYTGDANDLILEYLNDTDKLEHGFHMTTITMLKFILSTTMLRQVT